MLALLLAVAQDVTVTVGGRVEFDAVLRDRRLNEASYWRPGGLPSSSPLRDHDSFLAPLLRVRLDVEFSPSIAAVLELGNQRLNFDSFETQRQIQRLGDDDTAVDVREAHVLLRAWPVDEVDWRIGIVELHRDPSGWGHPLFFSSGSESPWGELPDSTVPPFPAAGTNTVPQTRRDELQTAGVVGRFLEDRFEATLWLFPREDEGIYGLDASLGIGDVTFGAVFALFETELDAWTAGAFARVEVGVFDGFAEAYLQFGDGDGWAFRGGARLRFDGPWVAVEVLWVSGDDDGLDDDEGRFLSYENNDATPIVEGNEFGLDIDTNYSAFRISGGLTIGTVEIRTMLSFFSLLEEIPLPPDPAFGVSGRSDDLGVEWDLGVRVPWTKQVAFDAFAAALFGSGVLEEFTLGRHDAAFLLGFGARLQF